MSEQLNNINVAPVEKKVHKHKKTGKEIFSIIWRFIGFGDNRMQ